MVDIELRAPVSRVDVAEDLHLIYEHMITTSLREADSDDSLPLDFARRREPSPVDAARTAGPEAGAPQLLQGLLLVAAACVGASSGSLVLLDEDGKQLAGALFYDGSVRRSVGEGLAEALERGLAGWVLQNRQAALIPDTQEDARWLRRAWEGVGAPSRSALSVPVGDDDRIRGVLTLAYPAAGRFTQEDLDLVSVMAARSRSLMVAEDSLVND
jgi:hypothetical protein